MTFPQALNDGTYNYTLVRDERDLGNGLADVAVYDRVPPTDTQYTPDLAWKLGQTQTPIMMPLGGDRIEPEADTADTAENNDAAAEDSSGSNIVSGGDGARAGDADAGGITPGQSYTGLIVLGLAVYFLMKH